MFHPPSLLFPDGHFETTFPTLTSTTVLPSFTCPESAGHAHLRMSAFESGFLAKSGPPTERRAVTKSQKRKKSQRGKEVGRMRILHVIFGTLPCVQITSRTQDVNMATNVDSDKLRLMGAQQKVEERWCERIGCIIEGVYTIGLCVSRFSSEEIYSTERRKFGIKSHRQVLQGHLAPNQNSGKKGFIARRHSEV